MRFPCVSTDNSSFWGDIAIGVYDASGSSAQTPDHLVCVMTAGQCTLTDQNKLDHFSYFTTPITLSGTIPATLADGEYLLSPVALQKGSATWTVLGYFDTNAMTYDMSQHPSIPMTIKDGKVLIDGADPDPADSYAVYVGKDVAIVGSSLSLPISLQNAEPICGLQFDVTLPSGVSYRKADGREDVTLCTARTTATKTDVFDFEKQNSSTLRVVACSTEGTAFAGKDGELVLLNLTVTTARQKGFTLKISNIVLTDSKAKAYRLPDYETKITAGTPDGVASTPAATNAATDVYRLDGIRRYSPKPGTISVIKSGAKARKVLER